MLHVSALFGCTVKLFCKKRNNFAGAAFIIIYKATHTLNFTTMSTTATNIEKAQAIASALSAIEGVTAEFVSETKLGLPGFGFRIDNKGVYHWFHVFGTGYVMFDHSYSQNTGRVSKGYAQGCKAKATVERLVGEALVRQETADSEAVVEQVVEASDSDAVAAATVAAQEGEEAKFYATCSVLATAMHSNLVMAGNCHACAVGTLVAAGMGYTVAAENDSWGNIDIVWRKGEEVQEEWAKWGNVFFTGAQGQQAMNEEEYKGEARVQLDSTGYTVQQLAAVEHTFETSYRAASSKVPFAQATDLDEKLFMRQALLDVVEVLAEIHGASATAEAEARMLFDIVGESDYTGCPNS